MLSKTKIALDMLMVVALFLSMGFHVFGAGSHKIFALLTCLLFIAHNVVQRKWYAALFSGPYTPARIANTAVNLFVMLAVLGIVVSGVLLARETAGGAQTAMTAARLAHLVSSYAACAGIAVHIGLHLKRRREYV